VVSSHGFYKIALLYPEIALAVVELKQHLGHVLCNMPSILSVKRPHNNLLVIDRDLFWWL
jgi:hypothetical protein